MNFLPNGGDLVSSTPHMGQRIILLIAWPVEALSPSMHCYQLRWPHCGCIVFFVSWSLFCLLYIAFYGRVPESVWARSILFISFNLTGINYYIIHASVPLFYMLI